MAPHKKRQSEAGTGDSSTVTGTQPTKRARHQASTFSNHNSVRTQGSTLPGPSLTQARRSAAQATRWAARWSFLEAPPWEPPLAEGIALRVPGDTDPQYLGSFADLCQRCGAKHWSCERPKLKLSDPVVFSSCCGSGAICLPHVFDAPQELQSFFSGSTTQARSFLDGVRMYNNVFSFTSLGTTEQHLSPRNNGVFTFKVRGALHHRIGSLYPDESSPPRFAQIYFYDPATDAMSDRRMAQFPSSADREIIESVQQVLIDANPYVQSFRTARQRLEHQDNGESDVCLRIWNESVAQGRDPRTYKRPTADEVAAIVVGDEDDPEATSAKRHLLVQSRSGNLQTVSCLHSAYLALRYPLLIPYGHSGWHSSIPKSQQAIVIEPGPHDEDSLDQEETDDLPGPLHSKCVSQLDFYTYHLQDRGEFSTLLHSRRLLQEFVVDAWCQIEASRLRWYRMNQKKVLRLSTQDALQEAASNGASAGDVGKKVILPGKFVNGPKYWSNLYHDAMAIVRSRGKPDLFITMTTNPAWREISEALLPGQQPQDRPDLVARVFNAKLKYLQGLLHQHAIFGRAVAMVRTTEFQKRGLPHAHILVILHKDDKPATAADVDKIVCAEIPDPALHPRLHNIVMNTMVHGPCGEGHACMKESRRPGRCGRGYPQPYMDETVWGNNTYPQYRRRNDGRVYYKSTDRTKSFPITNQNVAPYNPWLSLALNTHVNVEVATSISAVKYLYKYIYKGPDRVTVTLSDGSTVEEQDEIRSYLDARYVSAAEACTRIFEYSLHMRTPAVEDLPVHLPGNQTVLFDSSCSATELASTPPPRTKLTAFFETCKNDPVAARLTYADFPAKYTWLSSTKVWRARKKGESVGRIQYVASLSDERYFMRMLLHHVRCPTSFQALRTVGTVVHDTFRAACQALGLLSNDNEWDHCLAEAGAVKHAASVRDLFGIIICNNLVAHPSKLFEDHSEVLSDDCARKLEQAGIDNPPPERSRSLCLAFIAQVLSRLPGERSLKDIGLEEPLAKYHEDIRLVSDPRFARAAAERLQLGERWQAAAATFTDEQRGVFETVLASVRDSANKIFFLDGPGGTGKTFLENAILAKVRSDRRTAIAVASSGIAALLLDDARTAHSLFKIPIEDLGKTSTCNITRESAVGRTIASADLLIWDEAPMTHRLAIEAVDRTLRDLRANDALFGGLTVLFSGDWRQTLPVVPHAGPGQVVSSCLHHAPFWKDVCILRLTKNLRLLEGCADQATIQRRDDFAAWLLRVGDGKEEAQDGEITIPETFVVSPSSVAGLVDSVYAGATLARNEVDARAYYSGRMVLFPRNKDVDLCNELMLDKFSFEGVTVFSTDMALTDQKEADCTYPVEYLNSLSPPGMPPHRLRLKANTPIILLRNIDPDRGLCNGTRLIILDASPYLLRCTILSGARKCVGDVVLLPRITLHTHGNLYPFKLSRTQFPVRPAFAMTINKAQGQSLDTVGLDLREPVFSHGQLYVALSRATSADRIHVLLPGSKTRALNVVYPNALV